MDGSGDAMHSATKKVLLGAVFVAFTGCGGTKTLMPPRVDLQSFRKIGFEMGFFQIRF
jgi:hypothetical protein